MALIVSSSSRGLRTLTSACISSLRPFKVVFSSSASRMSRLMLSSSLKSSMYLATGPCYLKLSNLSYIKVD